MANTLFIGKVYQYFASLPSTNDLARELLTKSKPSEGMVIRAASQSAGRGQYGSRWESEPGKNLTLSVILYPVWLSASEQFRLSEAVALALRETIAGSAGMEAIAAESLAIKWPNDIWIGARKTAGVLIQNTLKGNFLDTSVIGIGLNVNQLEFPEWLPQATSMALASNTVFDLDSLMERLLACLEHRYLQLKGGHADALREEYHAHLYGRGSLRTFERPDGSRFLGIIQGVARDGRLIIRANDAEEHYAVKSVQLL